MGAVRAADLNWKLSNIGGAFCLCPSCSCSYHFFSLCQLTTLTIHNSLSLSLPAQDLPLSQIFPTIDSLPASGLTPRTSRPDRFFRASAFYVFSFFIIIFCLAPCGRLSWLLVSFWAHVNIVHRIVSYRIVTTSATFDWGLSSYDLSPKRFVLGNP